MELPRQEPRAWGGQVWPSVTLTLPPTVPGLHHPGCGPHCRHAEHFPEVQEPGQHGQPGCRGWASPGEWWWGLWSPGGAAGCIGDSRSSLSAPAPSTSGGPGMKGYVPPGTQGDPLHDSGRKTESLGTSLEGLSSPYVQGHSLVIKYLAPGQLAPRQTDVWSAQGGRGPWCCCQAETQRPAGGRGRAPLLCALDRPLLRCPTSWLQEELKPAEGTHPQPLQPT